MLKVYGCFTGQHDVSLVLTAAALCVLASLTVMNLVRHVRRTDCGWVWLLIAATSCGFGIWATHFIAMLAFEPGLPSGYDIPLTLMSLMAAIALTGIGLTLAVDRRWAAAPWLGGAVVGAGIAVMHYTGMSGFEVAGRIGWDPILVAVSIGVAIGFSAVALATGLGGGTARTLLGALVLTVAICGHHFIGMGAVAIVPDAGVVVPPHAAPTKWLAIAAAAAGFAILLMAFTTLAQARRERLRNLEVSHIRSLANAAVEGLLVCRGTTIVTANTSFARLTGRHNDSLTETDLDALFTEDGILPRLLGLPGYPLETVIGHADGTPIPVEIILRRIDFAERSHHVVAVRDLRDRKRAEENIRFLAHHDTLTELPNRASFARRLDQDIAASAVGGKRVAVLCLDLDRFKEVNDLFGHAAGDAMLRAVARCVGSTLDASQMMARLGGDEFAIIAPGLTDVSVLDRISQNILHALRRENIARGGGPQIATSIGIALYPDHAADVHTLMSHADTALYRAKAEGRGTYRLFEPEMAVSLRERRQLEHDLRRAEARNEFHLAYQPQTAIETGEVIGFEALLRWTHSERGNVPPDAFIPLAEETGTILSIGEWVLRTACREAAGWKRPLRIAVNVSAMQIHHPGFAETVHGILRETGLAPRQLELEITETALIRDFDRAIATLKVLQALGVGVAMDDFGTGYSSLSNLRAFPFNKIKIDRSFIRSVDSNDQAAAIVRAVLGLGKALGLPVLAEGVERVEELAFLRQAGCDEAQGYLIGKPADITQFAHMIGAAEPYRLVPAAVAA